VDDAENGERLGHFTQHIVRVFHIVIERFAIVLRVYRGKFRRRRRVSQLGDGCERHGRQCLSPIVQWIGRVEQWWWVVGRRFLGWRRRRGLVTERGTRDGRMVQP
jgi:hypothetical protein